MTIRQAGPEDFEAVARLNAQVQGLHAAAAPDQFKPPSAETFSRAVYDAMLAQPRTFLYLAEADGQAVGYIYAALLDRPESPFRLATQVAYVHQLSVDSTHRRHGYGEQLMQQVVDLAQAHGIRRIELDTWAFNTAARAFFARQGFTEFNVRLARLL